MTLPVRQPRSARRRRYGDRASSRLTRIRLLAALVLLASGGALYGLTTSPVFALDPGSVRIDGLRYTDPVAAQAALELQPGTHPNLFHVPTARLEAALMTVPTVRAASVRTRLPDELLVLVEERVPILRWRQTGGEWLIDVDGAVLAQAPADEDLPLVDDQRSTAAAASAAPAASALPVASVAAGPSAVPVPSSGSSTLGGPATELVPGARIASLDLEVARVLGAVTPAHLAEAGSTLALSVTDADGWVIESDSGWRAVFGHYAPESRPPSSIQGQLTCLRALLLSEKTVADVTLSLSDDGCGTFRSRPSAQPAPSGRRGQASPTARP